MPLLLERCSLESLLVDRALDTMLQLPNVSAEMEAKARETDREIERLQHCLSENEVDDVLTSVLSTRDLIDFH